MTGLVQLMQLVRVVGVEVGWWLSAGFGLLRRRPGRALLWSVVAVVSVLWHVWWLMGLLVVPVVGFGLWARIGPVSFQRRVAGPWWRWGHARWLRKRWAPVMEACGLARRVPGTSGEVGRQSPPLRRLSWVDGQLIATPGLLVGQTIDDYEAAADRLRVSLDANRVRVIANPSLTGCQIVWSFGDPLARPFNAVVPVPTSSFVVAAASVVSRGSSLDAVTLGRTEDGGAWRLPVGISTLVAGSSGSGKASLIWGLVFGLAPHIRSGLVQVHGVDLKGGMEFAMGRALFTRYAQQAEQAVVMLEDAAVAMQARAGRLAGVVRQHTPSLAEPLVVVLVDELAALIAYLPDRDLTKRAEAALSLLLSQGRAVGFFVFAFLQDPRKETVKMRHLFGQSLGLRLRDREEVAMVLGDGAVQAGAWCHKIPRSTPGVGFVLGEDGRPVRVRAGYVSDDMIRDCAARFPAARQHPINVPSEPARTSRSSTSRTSSRDGAGSGSAQSRAPRAARSSRSRSAASESAEAQP